MRPVVRGSCPTDGGGSPIKFSDYKEARDALISTMGNYCSYCETALHSAIDVEHVSPKSHHAELELEWTNFLLACDYCNPVKGHSDILLDDYFGPIGITLRWRSLTKKTILLASRIACRSKIVPWHRIPSS